MQYKHKGNTDAPLLNYCYSGKAVSATYSEYMSVALDIQHTMRMRRVILSSVACPAVPRFITLSTISGKAPLNIKCVV